MIDTTLATRLPRPVQDLLSGSSRLSRRGRKLAVAAHLLVIGVWLGTAFALLTLAWFGRFAGDHRTAHGAYVIFDFFDLWVMPTLGILALTSGFTLAVGTNFGVLIHRWVVFKIITVGIVLLVAWQLMQPRVRTARDLTSYTEPHDLQGLDTTILLMAAVFNLALFTVTTVSVFKPWSRTRFGDFVRERRLNKP